MEVREQPIRRVRCSLSALILILLLASAAFADKLPQLRYYALNVGQAECSLFVLPTGENIIIDAGRRGAKKEMVNYLKPVGVKKIDLLVAAHPHEDHIGGAEALLDNFKIKKI